MSEPSDGSRAPLRRTDVARRALCLLASALAIRIVHYLIIRRTACLDINLDPISDMEAFHRWALTIVGGDWLGRSDFHPFHPWQIAVAAKERWASWYGHAFHQEPFYPYFAALIYLFAPRQPLSIVVAQWLAGAGGCVLVYLAARRLMAEGAALAAGALSVLYGPYLYYESLMLRDSLMIPLNAVILWLVIEARERREERGAAGWWGAAGLLLGLGYVTKATMLPFFVSILVSIVWPGRSRTVRWGVAAAAMMVGFAIPLAPVVVRNLAVGAPPLKITTRGPIELINGNNPWHFGTGWFDGDDARVSGYARDILARADGKLIPTAAAVLESWRGDLGGLLWLQIRKTGFFLAPFEMPNNASYSYFRLNSPLLRHATLSFFWISPLACLGLIRSWPDRARFLPLYLFLGTGVVITIAFYVIARFRAPLMPAVLMLAGLGVWSILELARAARWGRLAVSLTIVAGLLALNVSADHPDKELVRPQDYLISIQAYAARGMQLEALEEAEAGRRLFHDVAELHRAAATLYLALGRASEARDALRDALAADPTDERTRRQLMSLGTEP